MRVLNLIQGVLCASPSLIIAQVEKVATVELPFSPVKLVFLIILVYIWLYFVQYIQFSPLVPAKYKSLATIATLFMGPFLLLVLLIIDTAKKSSKGGETFFEVAKLQIEKIISNLNFSRLRRHKEDETRIKLLDSSGKDLQQIYGHGDNLREERHIFNLTEQIISNALQQRASDILIDPKDELSYTIRHRVDGVLRVEQQLKADTCKAVINSIKAVSSMDISERRRPQDGAFMARQGDMTASFRVASAGVIHGEKLSIRVLNQDASTFTLNDAGFSPKQIPIIENQMQKPSGMILICGPTGSGKTTTLYAMLNQIDRYTRNVITVEDPIEAVLPESSQIEINPKADITFAKALRSILRQDPDVICVGEIRDEETAEIALRASQTGHLVLATIHCGSNAMAMVRLLDLGISPILLSSGLSVLLSQRLLRKLCDNCKRPAQLTQSLIDEFTRRGIDYSRMYEAEGCKRCNGTGYFGRTAIGDIMLIDDEVKADITSNVELVSELKTKGRREAIKNLRKEGLKRVTAGITSLQELKRVVG